MATPPAVLIVPLFKFVLAVVLVKINDPVDRILPPTSNASLGDSTLIPTVFSITRNVVEGIPFLLICKSILLPVEEL